MVLTVVQRGWRIYSDATPDSGLSALAAEDTAPELAYRYIRDGYIRIRIRLAETGGTAGTNLACTLQYSRDQTTWTSLPASGTFTGEHFTYADGMATAGGTVDTLLLTGSATAGKYFENSSTTQSIAANATGLEIDFCVKLHHPTTGTWFFRVLYNSAGVPVDSGFTNPSISITAANRQHTITTLGGDPGAEGLSEEFRTGDQKRCWYDGTRYWFFYTTSASTTTINYRYWDGTGEWSSEAQITGISDTTNAGRWRIWVENISGTYTVFLLLGNNQGTGVTRYLRKGTISGTEITWGSEQTITGDFGDEGNAIGVDDGDFIWVGGVVNGGGSIFARRSTNANDVTAFNAAKTLTDAGASESAGFHIIGLASDKALCLWYDSTDTDIHAAIVTDAGGFGAFTTVNTSATAHNNDWGWTVDKTNGFVYVSHTNSTTDGAGDILLQCFTIGSETWAVCTTPPSGAGNRPFGGDDHLPIQLLRDGRIAVYFTLQSTGEDRHVGYLIYSGGGTGGTWDQDPTHISPPLLGNADRIVTVGPGPTPDRLLVIFHVGDDPNTSGHADAEWWDELITDPHPIYMRAGTFQSSTTTATVPWPTHRVDDIALLICESAAENVTLTTANGFVEVADSPQSTGTAAATTATRLHVFWCRATSAAMGSPITNDPGNHIIAQILTFRRCIKTGDPWDVTAGGTQGTATRTIAVPGGTTTVAKALAVLIATNVTDGFTAGRTNSWNNADLSDFFFAAHDSGTSGNGGGYGVARGYRPTAGSFGTTDGRLFESSEQAYLAIALKPTLTPSGTSAMNIPMLTMSATGVAKHVATSSMNILMLTMSASGTAGSGATQTGTSALTIPMLTMTSDGVAKHVATSAMTIPMLTMSATGVAKHVATSTMNIPMLTMSATGAAAHVATSAMNIPMLTMSATGVVTDATGTSALTIPMLTMSASGIAKHAATSAMTIPMLQLGPADGSGVAAHQGTSAMNIPMLTMSATGAAAHIATSAMNIPMLTMSAVGGVLDVFGTSTLTIPMLTMSATGVAKHVATSAMNIPMLTMSASGSVSAGATGTSGITIPMLTMSATGAAAHIATSAMTIPMLTMSASGVAKHAATSATNIPMLTMTGVGWMLDVYATSSMTIPILTMSATGVFTLNNIVIEDKYIDRVLDKREQSTMISRQEQDAIISKQVGDTVNG